MRLESIQRRAATAVVGGLILIVGRSAAVGGDEPGRLGRLFRLGGGAAASSTSGPSAAPSTSAMTRPVPDHLGPPALATPPSTAPDAPTGPRLTPRPRVNRPATEADPLVTRVSLGRSDNGSQFGMFLQVFADGTVIDGEGVHRVAPEVLKPVVEAVSSGDLARFKGHCGGPAGDFIETVHVVAYERSLGRLRANAFSYSGNTQGCDHAVHHLQKVLDDLQARLSPATPTAAAGETSRAVPATPTSPPLTLTAP